LLTSLIGRAIRFFGVAALVYYFGPNMQYVIDRYFNVLTLIFIALLLGGFWLMGAL
jgi:membrane protein DedA with SNARE-associated domain